MSVLVLDRIAWDYWLRERQASGGDRFDEVWDGVYVVMPQPNVEHQKIVNGLAYVFTTVVQVPGLGSVFPGVNVSDRIEDWKHNDRVPDVAVYLNENPAEDRGAFWFGGPDLAVEITSPDDRTREKLGFYARVGVRELLILDREPWVLELYRLVDGELCSVGRSTPGESATLASVVLPLTFRLVPGAPRPAIEVAHADGRQRWTI